MVKVLSRTTHCVVTCAVGLVIVVGVLAWSAEHVRMAPSIVSPGEVAFALQCAICISGGLASVLVLQVVSDLLRFTLQQE